MFNNVVIANFPQSVPVKEFLIRSMFGDDVDKSLVTHFYHATLLFAIVILSVRPSVRLSVTLVDCVHMV